MSITLIRILFVCCTPIGIFILVMGVKLIRAGFSGQILEEISYQQEWQNSQSSRVAIFPLAAAPASGKDLMLAPTSEWITATFLEPCKFKTVFKSPSIAPHPF